MFKLWKKTGINNFLYYFKERIKEREELATLKENEVTSNEHKNCRRQIKL